MPEAEEAVQPAKEKEKKKKRTSVKKVKDKEKSDQTDAAPAEGEPAPTGGDREHVNGDADAEAEPAAPEEPEVQDVIVEYETSISEVAKKVADKQGAVDEGGAFDFSRTVKAGDPNSMKDLDEKKLLELKKVFEILDADGDGILSENDLRKSFQCLGSDVPHSTIKEMLGEAFNPLNFDSFVILIGYPTIEMDSEDVLMAAWSRWDPYMTGGVPEPKMFHDIMGHGDKFTEKEATAALKDAPMCPAKSYNDPPMIDYPAFCRQMCGLRKPSKYAKVVKKL